MNKREEDTSPEQSTINQDDTDDQPPLLPENPRELVENPAVAPEMLETAPEDLRGDLFKDPAE